MLEENRKKVKEAADFIKNKIKTLPDYGVILGSGLGELADEIEEKISIPYNEIPNFKQSTAPSHAGRMVIGKLGGKNVLALQGRFHLYEGYSAQDLAFSIRVMHELGVKNLIVTCAAGGVNRNFSAGSLMLITDHLNMTGANALTGPNDDELGPRFPVMFDSYSPELRKLTKKIALENKIPLSEGVYFGIAGPVFYTRAEIRMVSQLGGDAIGMSVVQEVITAIHCGMKVLGIANITDMALPDVEHHATEQEVIEMAKKTGPIFKQLLKSVIQEME
ncbi:MAG: purine-nucleoside phosphorylase [Candidatus Sericytochromatia bacterium]